MAKFCSNCGNELKEGAYACLNCGKRVENLKSAPKDLDKNLVIAIVVGVVGVALIMFFWFFIAIVDELEERQAEVIVGRYKLEESENFVSHSARKSCCLGAGGKWSNDRCVSGYWFDDDYYDSCVENSF